MQRDENWTQLAHVNDYLLLKIEDTKATGLVAGDTVALTCREQWEIVGAVGVGEIPFLRNVVREFDLCRLTDGHYVPAPTVTVIIPTVTH